MHYVWPLFFAPIKLLNLLMKKLVFIIGLLIVPMIFACNKQASKSLGSLDSSYAFDFKDAQNLTEVIDASVQQEKLVFLDVYTDWCLPCKMMDEDVFTNKELGDFFNENFISYKVNAEKGKGSQIAELYQVPGYPTLLFLDNKGRILVKKIGVAYHEELRNLAESAISKSDRI